MADDTTPSPETHRLGKFLQGYGMVFIKAFNDLLLNREKRSARKDVGDSMVMDKIQTFWDRIDQIERDQDRINDLVDIQGTSGKAGSILSIGVFVAGLVVAGVRNWGIRVKELRRGKAVQESIDATDDPNQKISLLNEEIDQLSQPSLFKKVTNAAQSVLSGLSMFGSLLMVTIFTRRFMDHRNSPHSGYDDDAINPVGTLPGTYNEAGSPDEQDLSDDFHSLNEMEPRQALKTAAPAALVGLLYGAYTHLANRRMDREAVDALKVQAGDIVREHVSFTEKLSGERDAASQSVVAGRQ